MSGLPRPGLSYISSEQDNHRIDRSAVRGNDFAMKTRFALLASVVIVMVGAAWVIGQRRAPALEIQLRSDPFPLTVGPTTLLIALQNTDGTPVDGAVVQVSGQMNHPAMLPIQSGPGAASGGEYRVPVIWPMAGQWTLDVTAELPDQKQTLREQFVVYIYPMTPYDNSRQSTYTSVSETNAAVSANPARELWIVIPQGTRQMLIVGDEHEIIPDEIRLQVSGRNVLVIRNDDLADHTIGPFFVRAGETIRQQFTQPAVFEGTCSISHSDEISIIVEA
jgi:hypothetical protein